MNNIFKKLQKRELTIIATVIFILFVILSPLVVIANKGFYYGETNDHIIVKLRNDSTLDFNKLSDLDNTTRVLKDDKQVFLQGVNSTDLESTLKDKLKLTDIYTEIELIEVRGNSIYNLINNSAISLLVGIIVMFLVFLYTYFRKEVRNGYIVSSYMALIFAISTLASNVIFFGFISFLSRFSHITFDQLGTNFIIYVVITILLVIVSNKLNSQVLDIKGINTSIVGFIENNFSTFIYVLFLSILPIVFIAKPVSILNLSIILLAVVTSISSLYICCSMDHFYKYTIKRSK